MGRISAALLLAGALAGCGTANLNQWDPVFIGHAGLTIGVPSERMGVLFGSIALVPPNESVTGFSVHLRPLGDPSREIGVFASNRKFNTYWRAPDVDTVDEKIWVFSGQLPAGTYEIVKIGVSIGSVRNVSWYELPRPIPVVAKAAGSIYLGRWVLAQRPEAVPGPKLMWEGADLVFHDAFAQDLKSFETARKRLSLPHSAGPVENPLPALIRAQGGRP